MAKSSGGITRAMGAMGMGSRCTLLVVAALAAACGNAQQSVAPETAADRAVRATPAGAEGSGATLNREIAELRHATARFHRFEVAEEAGYTVLVTHPTSGAACLDHPTEGGMGRHYLNPALVDDAVSVADPEVVLYEPQANGRLRLVGFEYVIPFAIRGPGETPPTLFGQEFQHNTTFNLWMLHVYSWKNNPGGMFATWNPNITCEHDAKAD